MAYRETEHTIKRSLLRALHGLGLNRFARLSDVGGGATNELLTDPRTFTVTHAAAPSGAVLCALEATGNFVRFRANGHSGSIVAADGDLVFVEDAAGGFQVYFRVLQNKLMHGDAGAPADFYVPTVSGRALKVEYEAGVPTGFDQPVYFDQADSKIEALMFGSNRTLETDDHMAFGYKIPAEE